MEKARLILLVAVIIGLTAVSVWAKPAESAGFTMPQGGGGFVAPDINIEAAGNQAPLFQPAAGMPPGYYVVTQDVPLYDVPGGYQGYGNQIQLSTNDQGGVAYLHAGDIVQITGQWAGGSEAISRIQIPGSTEGVLEGDAPIIATGVGSSFITQGEIVTITVISSSEGATGAHLITDITGVLGRDGIDGNTAPIMSQQGIAATATVGEGGAQYYTLQTGWFGVVSATPVTGIAPAAQGMQLTTYGGAQSTGIFGLGGQYSYVGNGLWVNNNDLQH